MRVVDRFDRADLRNKTYAALSTVSMPREAGRAKRAIAIPFAVNISVSVASDIPLS